MQEASPDANAGKPEWRRWFRRQARDRVDPAASAAIRAHLGAFLAGRPPAEIAAFVALPGEPDLLEALVPPHRWHLPRVAGDQLHLHPFRSRAELVAGAFGIPEPPPDGAETDPAVVDLFLCPGLGFDRHGTRLGRGKGHYDRLLARARADALVVGVAFEEHLVDRLPDEAHDRPMTHLLTPAGILPADPRG